MASVVAAALYAETSPKRYEATADLLVSPVSPGDTTFVGIRVLRESSDQSRAVLTVARLVQSPQLAAVARRRLAIQTSPQGLLKMISVGPLGQSQIVTITGTASNPRTAAAIANAFANALVRTRSAEFQADVRTQIKRLRTNLERSRPISATPPRRQRFQQRLGKSPRSSAPPTRRCR